MLTGDCHWLPLVHRRDKMWVPSRTHRTLAHRHPGISCSLRGRAATVHGWKRAGGSATLPKQEVPAIGCCVREARGMGGWGQGGIDR